MSFGHRSRDDREASREPLSPVERAATGPIDRLVEAWQGLPTGVRQLGKFGLVLFIVASTGMALQAQKMAFLSGYSDRQSESVESMLRGRGIETALPVLDVPAQIAQHNAALQSACAETLQSESARLRGGARDMSLVRGKIWVPVDRTSAFLTCLMTHELKRFCHASERRKLIDLLDQAIATHRRTATYLEQLEQTPAGGMVSLYRDVDDAIKGRDGGIATRPALPGDLGPGLLRALQGLTHNGYLTPRDFGRSPPHEIKDYIEQPQMEACKS